MYETNIMENIKKQMESMCRTCMRSRSKLRPLFGDDDLCFRIELLTSIRITRDDRRFPPNICEECTYYINKFYNFRIIIINNDSDFRDRFQALQLPTIARNDITYKNISIANKNRKKTTKINTHQNAIKEDPLGGVEFKSTDTDLPNCVNLNHEVIIKNEEFEIEEGDYIVVEDQEMTDEEGEKMIDENEIIIGEYITKEEIDNNKPNVSGKNHFDNMSYDCNTCNLTFNDYKEWDKHKKDAHRKYSICNFCGKSITTYNFNTHLKIHTSGPVNCKVCGKEYKNKVGLQSHMLFHKREDITCKLCGTFVTSRRQYYLHMRTHKFKKQVKCTICGKDISYPSIQKHMRVHTGERPYICQHCGKGFSSTNARKTHIRQHTHEKPYLCEFCPMGFPQGVSLRTHIRSKHSDKTK